jgi:acetyl esterase/lipase
MQIYTHTLPGGAQLIGYLRDRTVEMPAFNTRPAILILPGGGYAWCSRREADPVAMQFLQAGYNVFTLYYTCRSDETVPALRWQPLIDAAGAILHIRRNAEPVQTALGIHGTEARPDAVVLGYPVITAGEYRHDGSIVNLCGGDADLRATMSLENQVRDGLPPFFVWHTVEDPSVPVQNSLMLAGALTAHKVPLELHLFAHDGHGTSTCTREVNTPNKHNSAWVALCTDWLAETFDFHL